MSVPMSTGIGAPGTNPAPADLSRSPMASQPSGGQAAIPFVRGSTLASMQDFQSVTLAAASTTVEQLQTNAFLSYLLLDCVMTTSGNSAAVAYNDDGPWNVFSFISLNDPANQAIITPITGFGAYLLTKYLTDTGCFFDPQSDPNYSATTGSGGTGGSFSFRLVIPIEHRKRDALGAVNNSAANQRYLLTMTTATSYVGTSVMYSTAPSSAGSFVVNCTQLYWTLPPASITTSGGSTKTTRSPNGLGTVAFIRYEKHTEVSGGGSPIVQLNNVGDYLSWICFVLRSSTTANGRDQTDWPSPFAWWINDYQIHNLSLNVFVRELARYYRYDSGAVSTATASKQLDLGVFPLWTLTALLDRVENYGPASQYLPTDATTKLQIKGCSFGASASFLEVYTRAIRPQSGATLFA